jgi:hypothetical protein
MADMAAIEKAEADHRRLKAKAVSGLAKLSRKADWAMARPWSFAMTEREVQKTIAAKTGLTLAAVMNVFWELRIIASEEIAKNEKFAIPQLVRLKLQHAPAKKVVKAFAAKNLKKNVEAFAAKAMKTEEVYDPGHQGQGQVWVSGYVIRA